MATLATQNEFLNKIEEDLFLVKNQNQNMLELEAFMKIQSPLQSELKITVQDHILQISQHRKT